MKCPACGQTANDKDFNEGTAQLDFTCNFETGIWNCNCFVCNCEWEQKGKDGKQVIVKKGDYQ
jgi:hypothetical protein